LKYAIARGVNIEPPGTVISITKFGELYTTILALADEIAQKDVRETGAKSFNFAVGGHRV
jgi:hypothetical protein